MTKIIENDEQVLLNLCQDISDVIVGSRTTIAMEAMVNVLATSIKLNFPRPEEMATELAGVLMDTVRTKSDLARIQWTMEGPDTAH